MYVIANAWKMFHTEFIGIFIIYLHTKFQMYKFNGPLGLSIKKKTKYSLSLAPGFLMLKKKLY
jgi:hypothetical protein